MSTSKGWGERIGGSARRIRARVEAFEERFGLGARIQAFISEGERKLLEGEHFANPEYSRRVRLWYARLELEEGAEYGEVKRAYRELMMRYHPDHFVHDAAAEALASEICRGLNEAHKGLRIHLGK